MTVLPMESAMGVFDLFYHDFLISTVKKRKINKYDINWN